MTNQSKYLVATTEDANVKSTLQWRNRYEELLGNNNLFNDSYDSRINETNEISTANKISRD